MSTWSILEYATRIVVVPTTDIDEHGEYDDLDTDNCKCNPKITKENWNTKKVVTHNSWDKRELKENMNSIQNKLTQEKDPEIKKMIIDFVMSIAKITNFPTATYELWETKIDDIIKKVREKNDTKITNN